MRWWLIKLLCIAAGYLAGAWAFREPIAGILIAPFGWILGKAMELNAEVRRVEKEGTIYTPVVNGEIDEEWWWNDYLKETRCSPKYFFMPCNIFYDEDWDKT